MHSFTTIEGIQIVGYQLCLAKFHLIEKGDEIPSGTDYVSASLFRLHLNGVVE